MSPTLGHGTQVSGLILAQEEPGPRLEQLPVRSSDLIAEHSARVWRSLRYLGVPDQDLPDACQETFLVMHRRLPEFRGDSSYATWVYGICLHVARNQRRTRRRAQARYGGEPTDSGYESGIERRLDFERATANLKRALLELSQEQREVFVLHEIEELPMSQVAATLGCSLFTAYSRCRLARGKLRKSLERLGGER